MRQRGELIPVLAGPFPMISFQTIFLELQASEAEPGEKEKEEAETK